MNKHLGLTDLQWSWALMAVAGPLALFYAFAREDIAMSFISFIFFCLGAGSAFRSISDSDEDDE